MESESTGKVVANWMFLVSAMFAAGILVILAKPMIEKAMSKKCKGFKPCNCAQPQVEPTQSLSDEGY